MRCSNCNFNNDSKASFCRNCGSPLNSGTNAAPIKQKTELDAKTKSMILTAVQAAFYLGIIAMMMFVTFFEKGVKVQSTYSAKTFKEFSFISVLINLISGGEKYNPTAISIIIGVSTVILIFGAASFWLVTLITRCIGKGYRGSYVITLVLTVLCLASICLALPLAGRFSGIINLIYSREAHYAITEMKSISSVWTYISSAIIAVLMIAERIVASFQKKLKKQMKERV